MRNITNFIKKQKTNLILFYILGFILVVLMILFSLEKGSEANIMLKPGMTSIVITHISDGYSSSGCFGFYNSRRGNTIDNPPNVDLFGSTELTYNYNHYTQSAIMLPSIFIACCLIILYDVSSYLKRITS